MNANLKPKLMRSSSSILIYFFIIAAYAVGIVIYTFVTGKQYIVSMEKVQIIVLVCFAGSIIVNNCYSNLKLKSELNRMIDDKYYATTDLLEKVEEIKKCIKNCDRYKEKELEEDSISFRIKALKAEIKSRNSYNLVESVLVVVIGYIGNMLDLSSTTEGMVKNEWILFFFYVAVVSALIIIGYNIADETKKNKFLECILEDMEEKDNADKKTGEEEK